MDLIKKDYTEEVIKESIAWFAETIREDVLNASDFPLTVSGKLRQKMKRHYKEHEQRYNDILAYIRSRLKEDTLFPSLAITGDKENIAQKDMDLVYLYLGCLEEKKKILDFKKLKILPLKT